MKRVLLLLLLSGATAASAAVSQRLNYQGKLADAAGNPLTGTYSLRFKLFASDAGGAQLWSEDVTGSNALAVTNGIYTVQIGSLTTGGIPYSAFSGGNVFLEIDVNAGSNLTSAETLSPRERLTASPYSIHALGAERLGYGAVIATFTSAGNLELVSGSTITSNGTLSISTAASAALTATPALFINQAGKIGIGTAGPAYRLSVAADASTHTIYSESTGANGAVMGYNVTNGAQGLLGYGIWGVYCLTGTCGGTSGWTNTSDRRLKTAIRPIEGALDKILQLNGVYYHWRNPQLDANQGEKIGMIAQDVEKVFPQAVKTDETSRDHLPGGTKMVTYTDLIGPIIQAIKELNQKTVRLEGQVIELKRKLALLEAKKAAQQAK